VVSLFNGVPQAEDFCSFCCESALSREIKKVLGVFLLKNVAEPCPQFMPFVMFGKSSSLWLCTPIIIMLSGMVSSVNMANRSFLLEVSKDRDMGGSLVPINIHAFTAALTTLMCCH
jgi:hypothetical protein